MKKEQKIRQKDCITRRSSTKYIALVVALLLTVGGVVSGTVAWLIDQTETVENTFTYGDIDITLEETKTDEKGNPVIDGTGNLEKTTEGNEYKMMPGEKYLKDPKITVEAGNEACWLFVKMEKTGGITVDNGDGTTTEYSFDDYLEVAVADGWAQLVDDNGVAKEGLYFRKFEKDWDGTPEVLEVLKNNEIIVKSSVNKEMLNALDNNGQSAATANYPKLSITAYAMQYSSFEAEITEGATEPTDVQLNAAALGAWKAIEDQNNPVTP